MNIFTNIVRSNQNAVMTRIELDGNISYRIFDLRTQSYTYQGTLNATKKAWNRHYRNSRQWTSGNGVNHRYMTQA
jgi:hypothetical protein